MSYRGISLASTSASHHVARVLDVQIVWMEWMDVSNYQMNIERCYGVRVQSGWIWFWCLDSGKYMVNCFRLSWCVTFRGVHRTASIWKCFDFPSLPFLHEKFVDIGTSRCGCYLAQGRLNPFHFGDSRNPNHQAKPTSQTISWGYPLIRKTGFSNIKLCLKCPMVAKLPALFFPQKKCEIDIGYDYKKNTKKLILIQQKAPCFFSPSWKTHGTHVFFKIIWSPRSGFGQMAVRLGVGPMFFGKSGSFRW